jgi:CheY-like chemotaxis protein
MKKVLVFDDNLDILQVLELILEGEGYEVEVRR